MSMLAERKQKQKWTLNPRGKFWSDDSNKFGQKMLEKMGWSAGKGLGAKEDGITEHIKQSYKNDSKGIGFEDKGDQWTKHEVDFTSLLQNLGTSADIQIKKPAVSLEKKSQNSRARLHYHKFTRSKDLSRYSEKDLANVFGRKTLEKTNVVENMNEESNLSDSNKEFGVQIVYGGNMADYFKTKIKGFITKTPDKADSDNERPRFGQCEENTIENFDENDSKDLNPFKSKFKNIFCKSTDDNNYGDEKLGFGFSDKNKTNKFINDNGGDKKKKNSTNVVSNECFDNPGFTDFPDTEQETISQEKVKKKYNKNKHKEIMLYDNAGLNVDIQNEETSHLSTPKKRKLDTIIEESVTENDNANGENIVTERNNEECYTPAKKKSKKHKNKKEIDSQVCSELNDICEEHKSVEESNESLTSKRKKKITKVVGIVNTACTELNVINEDNSPLESTIKSSKKKKITTKVGIYNVACTEDYKDDVINNIQERSISEDIYEVKSAKKKKKQKTELGIDNAACTEVNTSNVNNTTNSELSTTKESKILKKKKSKENGVDNLACNANSVEQNIEEAISSMSNAIDNYQLELENEMNERKLSKEEKRNQKKLNQHFRYAKRSVKADIIGDLRYNFEGSNLPKIPGYGMNR